MYPLPFFNPSSTDGCSGQALAKTAGANWRHIRAARFLQRKWRAKKRGEDISVSMADIAQMRIEQHRQEVQRMYASGNWASQKKQQDSNRAGAAKRRQLAEAQAKREKAEAERLEREARERQEAAEAEAEYALTAAAQNIAEGAPKAMHDPNFILVDKLQTPEMAEAAAEHPLRDAFFGATDSDEHEMFPYDVRSRAVRWRWRSRVAVYALARGVATGWWTQDPPPAP